MVTRTKLILQDLSLVAIWNFEKQIWDFPDNKMLHITKMATTCIKKKKKKSLILALFWYFVWPRKALSGPILVPFIILSDPREKKNRNCFLSTIRKRGDEKSVWKGKSDRKRGEKGKGKAAGGDSSRLIPLSGFRPLSQLPTSAHFLRPNFPLISPVLLFGSKVWPKIRWN